MHVIDRFLYIFFDSVKCFMIFMGEVTFKNQREKKKLLGLMEKVKVIFFLALFSHGSDKGSSRISLKRIYFCSIGALVRTLLEKRGQPEVGSGGASSFIPCNGGTESRLSNGAQARHSFYYSLYHIRQENFRIRNTNVDIISRIEEISTYLDHGF